MIVKKGDTFKERNTKYHVVSILGKELYKPVVLKYYGKHKQWWHYQIKELDEIEEWLKCGLYKDHKRGWNEM